jgi:hypothetical protein
LHCVGHAAGSRGNAKVAQVAEIEAARRTGLARVRVKREVAITIGITARGGDVGRIGDICVDEFNL